MDPDSDDAYEPTDAETEQDRQLAVGTAVATLTGAAALAGIYEGAATAAAAPVILAIASAAVSKLGKRRAENAADTIVDGAEAVSLPVADFINKAVADARHHELFARALAIAQDTALREKRRALGRALAASIEYDYAKVDEEMLFIRTLADIDEPHIRLLAQLASSPGIAGRDLAEIYIADEALGTALPTLLGPLQLHGLVRTAEPAGPFIEQGSSATRYRVSDYGRVFLDRLAEDPA